MKTSLKKRRPERRNKVNWRKNVDTTDVENFLDDKRLDERLGLKQKKDEELFTIDTDIKTENVKKRGRSLVERKKWASEPSYYKKLLIPQSAVNDPLIKRNRVRTKEERAGDRKPKPGVLKRLEQGIQQRREHFANKKLREKREKEITFEKDLWQEEKCPIDMTWFNEETAKITLSAAGLFKVKPPKQKRLPEINAVENPHPGLSYNPSLADHRKLLEEIAERELEEIKKEQHLKRVLSAPKLTAAEQESMWMAERVAGLTEEDVKEEEPEVQSELSETKKNPPVTREGKKTLKQRRRIKELAEAKRKRVADKLEKKKLSDIYKLRQMGHSIGESESRAIKTAQKRREQIHEKRRFGVERLARLKFEEPRQELLCPHELGGSLRTAPNRPAAILKDRFASLQRRNILPPSKLTAKTKKRVVKRFVKASHRLEDAEAEHYKLHGIEDPKKTKKPVVKKQNDWKVNVYE